MSGRRRRSSGDADADDGRRGGRLLARLGWGVVVTLLLGNLVMGLVDRKGDKPQGFITPDLLLSLAFWIPAAGALAMSAAGLYWSNKAYAQNERSSLLWARRGYVFGMVGATAFLVACFDRETFPREWIVCVAAAVIAGQSLFFGMMSFREFRRAQSGGGGRRGRSSGAEAAQGDEVPAPSAESSDTGR